MFNYCICSSLCVVRSTIPLTSKRRYSLPVRLWGPLQHSAVLLAVVREQRVWALVRQLSENTKKKKKKKNINHFRRLFQSLFPRFGQLVLDRLDNNQVCISRHTRGDHVLLYSMKRRFWKGIKKKQKEKSSRLIKSGWNGDEACVSPSPIF